MPIDFQNSTPLYIQIKEDIKDKISDKRLGIGEQLKSHKELAEEYDVSLITIKNALSNLIDDGYLYSRVGKGTFVAQRATNGSIKHHDSIGLVLQDLKNPFFSLIAHEIEETAYSKSYNMLLSNSSSQVKKEENQIKRFKELGVKGMIVATLRKELRPPKIIRELLDEGFPLVMVSYVKGEDIWYVGTDHEEGAALGTKHLIDLGHTKIGYINSPSNNSLGNLRLNGFKKTLEKYNLGFNPDYILELDDGKSSHGFNSGYKLGDVFHTMNDKPTAFFVYNDLSALGFIKRVQELGYSVPDDVAIVGFDDIEQARYAEVPLTTIHQPIEKIGATAIEKLIQIIEGKKPEVRTTFAPTLIVRESSGTKI
ncbi:MAG: GntR family transcriptional regulator [Balneolales bacterium]|nr:GntR family transcriptional regulator [Balneolales bacterium]